MAFEDSALPQPSLQKVGVVWLDVNTQIGINGRPDLLPNIHAVGNSLYNLLRCPIGARGAIHQPEYGTLLYQFLHDPCDYITGDKIKICFIQAIQRWESRIKVNIGLSSVDPDFRNNQFIARISYDIINPQQSGILSTFLLRRN
jgi:phage baseplate assembly protein W